jgi:hypothetical protein
MKRTRQLLLSLSLASATVLTAPSAQARSLPGSGGHSQSFEDQHCFTDNNLQGSADQTNCTNKPRWVIPLPADLGGSSPAVVVSSPRGTTIECEGMTYSSDLVLHTFWADGSNSLGGIQTINLKNLDVPNQGHMFVFCNVPQGGRIHNVNW